MSIVMHLCVCLYVCKCMRKNLYLYETPIYFRNIYYLLLILLWRVSNSYMCMSFKFGKEIPIIKGVHQNGFYSYFGAFSIWIVII